MVRDKLENPLNCPRQIKKEHWKSETNYQLDYQLDLKSFLIHLGQ